MELQYCILVSFEYHVVGALTEHIPKKDFAIERPRGQVLARRIKLHCINGSPVACQQHCGGEKVGCSLWCIVGYNNLFVFGVI
jgi:hypothetical protein